MIKSSDCVETLLPEWHLSPHGENRFCTCFSGSEETPQEINMNFPLFAMKTVHTNNSTRKIMTKNNSLWKIRFFWN